MQALPQEPRCQCGYPRDHAWVIEKPKYSLKQWMIVLTGVSAIPRAVVVACDRCGFVFEESTDLERRKKAM